jgi:hypothetical protein
MGVDVILDGFASMEPTGEMEKEALECGKEIFWFLQGGFQWNQGVEGNTIRMARNAMNFLNPLAHPPQLEIFDHALSQASHGIPPFLGKESWKDPYAESGIPYS